MAIKQKLAKFFKSIFKRKSKVDELLDWQPLTALYGIGEKNAKLFLAAGFKSPEEILSASDEDLLAIPGVGQVFVRKLRRNNAL